MNEQELTRIFIGPRANQYLKKWQDNKLSFCWPALFFGIYWLLYRKMYFYSFLIFLLGGVLTIILSIMGISIDYLGYVGLFTNIILAIMGNNLYRNFVATKVKKYQKNPKYSLQIFALNGGVTWGIPLMWLFIYLTCLTVFVLQALRYAQYSVYQAY